MRTSRKVMTHIWFQVDEDREWIWNRAFEILQEHPRWSARRCLWAAALEGDKLTIEGLAKMARRKS